MKTVTFTEFRKDASALFSAVESNRFHLDNDEGREEVIPDDRHWRIARAGCHFWRDLSAGQPRPMCFFLIAF